MFQRSHFRTSTSTTPAATSDSASGHSKRHVTVRGSQAFSLHSAPDATRSSSTLSLQQQVTRTRLKPDSLRRLLFAVVTLRLTSTSTSTAVGTTSSGTLLVAFLKSLLVGCYYLLAFTSLLMLIVYINQFASQQSPPQAKMSAASVQHSPPLQQEASNMAIIEAQNKSYRHLFERMKRSVQVTFSESRSGVPALAPAATKTNRTSNKPNPRQRFHQTTGKPASVAREDTDLELTLSSSMDLQRRHQVLPNVAPEMRPATRVPELSFRQASPRQNDSQWIPIIPAQPTPQKQQIEANSRQHRPQQPAPTRQPPPSQNQQPVALARSESFANTRLLSNINESPFLPPNNNEPPFLPPLPPMSDWPYPQLPQIAPAASHSQRYWRRPRFNLVHEPLPPLRLSKMYKRVLLCDKTLVSLDYIRHPFTLNPSGHMYPHPHHFDGDLDDNFINLDTNLGQVFADRQQLSDNATSLSTSGSMNEEILAMERRSYLTDEDPLVKCDMWDLEKGLKNRKPPKEILRMAVKADFDTVRDAINRCRQLSEKTLPPDDEYRDGLELISAEDLVSLFSMKRGLMPGTKWCGLGDQASSYNDLGSKHRIDICCRAHDHCPIRLKPFRNDYGVLNIALYTKSHCDCDADFYRCLREAHSRMADMLGNLYFNVMKLQCMREERMKVCREMKPIALGFERCVRYEESPVKRVFKFTTPPVAY